MSVTYKYHHLGIPKRKRMAREIHLKELKVHVTDHESNAFGIQWMRFAADCPVPELVKKVPHVAFEVDLPPFCGPVRVRGWHGCCQAARERRP